MGINSGSFPADDPGESGMGQDDPDSDLFVIDDDGIEALGAFDELYGEYPLYL